MSHKKHTSKWRSTPAYLQTGINRPSCPGAHVRIRSKFCFKWASHSLHFLLNRSFRSTKTFQIPKHTKAVFCSMIAQQFFFGLCELSRVISFFKIVPRLKHLHPAHSLCHTLFKRCFFIPLWSFHPIELSLHLVCSTVQQSIYLELISYNFHDTSTLWNQSWFFLAFSFLLFWVSLSNYFQEPPAALRFCAFPSPECTGRFSSWPL